MSRRCCVYDGEGLVEWWLVEDGGEAGAAGAADDAGAWSAVVHEMMKDGFDGVDVDGEVDDGVVLDRVCFCVCLDHVDFVCEAVSGEVVSGCGDCVGVFVDGVNDGGGVSCEGF
jgi:hypothetical protein